MVRGSKLDPHVIEGVPYLTLDPTPKLSPANFYPDLYHWNYYTERQLDSICVVLNFGMYIHISTDSASAGGFRLPDFLVEFPHFEKFASLEIQVQAVNCAVYMKCELVINVTYLYLCSV